MILAGGGVGVGGGTFQRETLARAEALDQVSTEGKAGRQAGVAGAESVMEGVQGCRGGRSHRDLPLRIAGF